MFKNKHVKNIFVLIININETVKLPKKSHRIRQLKCVLEFFKRCGKCGE